MTIRSLEKYINALWDWSCLDGCFGNSKISLTDIDGMAEHKGHFILIEAKRPGAAVPMGQQIMFNQLVKLGFLVIVFWGEDPKIQKLCVWPNDPIPANMEDLRKLVADWYIKS